MRREEIITQFAKFKLYPEGGRRAYFLYMYFIAHAYSLDDVELPAKTNMISQFCNHTNKWYFADGDLSVIKKILENVLNDSDYIHNIERRLSLGPRAVETIINQANLREISNTELVGVLKECQNKYERMALCATSLRRVDKACLDYFNDISDQKSEADAIIRTVSVSDELTTTLQEERKLLQIARDVKRQRLNLEDMVAQSRIKEIFNKYRYISLGYYTEKPKELVDYMNYITQMIKQDPEVFLRESEIVRKQEIMARDKIVNSLSQQDRKIAHIISEIPRLKDLFKLSINHIIFLLDIALQEAALRSSCSLKYLKDLTPEECHKLLLGDSIDERKVLERTENSVLLGGEEGLIILSGKEAEEYSAHYLRSQKVMQTKFSGRSACTGIYKGRVRTILSSEDFSKMNDNDIIVALNTTPDYVPIIKRAGAIITEEGGITAHASLVSRELGVPCVVGVPHITEVLKDGDLVQVDADHGIIEIIK